MIATNHIVPLGMYGYDPGLTAPDGTTTLTGDVTKATQLMQTYAAANCGGQMSKCTPVTLYDANDPTLVTADQAAVQMWQTAFPGYPIHTQFIDFNTLISLIYSTNEPQIFGIGWSADYADPQDFLSLQFGSGSINNVGNVNVPAANTLMAAGRCEPEFHLTGFRIQPGRAAAGKRRGLDTVQPAEDVLQPRAVCS